MGRQTEKAASEGRETFARQTNEMRLDPFSLPHRFRYDTGVDPRSGKPMGDAAVLLESHMASICRRLPSGIPMAMRLPMAAFEGVAARVIPAPHGEDDGLVVLELLHRDPHLSLPLSVAETVDDVVADWRAWSRVLALPMLMVEDDGSWRSLETRIGSVAVKPTRPRRRRSVLAGRRPRFLTRRKVGVVSRDAMRLEKREMFGRE